MFSGVSFLISGLWGRKTTNGLKMHREEVRRDEMGLPGGNPGTEAGQRRAEKAVAEGASGSGRGIVSEPEEA
eukprot:CAMPEP_0177616670 /NCGR_PEP_ID=MMETSP0419_2-20121207/24312_1 /TAXON_ID=582737 /ORGANISM="Tetraselmis sp., Strain GSL018" /LENGTH=71 /DNA_ID=CAMNT_0019114809 /DNA_START=92 /DNA_END=304 /DNA_ORIENTATION=-